MHWARTIQDILLVTLISILIWLYAEGRNVETYSPNAPVPVRVELAADDLVVLEQEPERFSMQFRGAQSELDRVRRAISGGIELALDQAEPGEMSLVMSDQLREADPIAGLNVNVTSVEPLTMRVVVDRLVEREATLTFEPQEVSLAENSLEIEPEVVSLTLPEGLLSELEGNDALTLAVEPTVPLRLLSAGQRQEVRGRVVLPPELADEPHVQVVPREVRLRFTIEEREDAVTLPSVPVWVMSPPTDLAEYDVALEEESRVLRDVRVSGPSDLVERVRDGSLRVVATLPLSSDDLARAAGDTATGTVSFHLPPRLTVTADETTVRYSVRRRED